MMPASLIRAGQSKGSLSSIVWLVRALCIHLSGKLFNANDQVSTCLVRAADDFVSSPSRLATSAPVDKTSRLTLIPNPFFGDSWNFSLVRSELTRQRSFSFLSIGLKLENHFVEQEVQHDSVAICNSRSDMRSLQLRQTLEKDPRSAPFRAISVHSRLTGRDDC